MFPHTGTVRVAEAEAEEKAQAGHYPSSNKKILFPLQILMCTTLCTLHTKHINISHVGEVVRLVVEASKATVCARTHLLSSCISLSNVDQP